jgi:hypothetical protein
MNRSILLLAIYALTCISAIAQKTKSNPKVFIARVAMIGDTRAIGVLTLVSDTTIVLIPLRKQGTPILDGKDTLVIRTRDVKHVGIKRKASVGRGILIGLSTGAVVGLVVGLASEGEDSCDGGYCVELEGGATAGGAILGAMTGSIVGGIIGLIPRTFKINGHPLSQEQKIKLGKFALH